MELFPLTLGPESKIKKVNLLLAILGVPLKSCNAEKVK